MIILHRLDFILKENIKILKIKNMNKQYIILNVLYLFSTQFLINEDSVDTLKLSLFFTS